MNTGIRLLLLAAFGAGGVAPCHAQLTTELEGARPSNRPGTRDMLLWPFAQDSIWNMPIGSDAVYVPAELTADPGNGNIYAHMPGADQDHIILTPTAPLARVKHSNVGWRGGERCVTTNNQTLMAVPIPDTYIVPNGRGNNAAAILTADGAKIMQIQPLTRCAAGSYATSLATSRPVDIKGPGITGAHGGSGLSAIGGTLRLGELRPDQRGPRHALKIEVFAAQYLYQARHLGECSRWPATNCDDYAAGEYGTHGRGNFNTAMKQGSLLAIPAMVDIASLGLETEPGRQLAWTLQNYGAYIVDDTGTPGYDICIETGPAGSKEAEFLADWGFPFSQKAGQKTPWVRDFKRLVIALHVVDNNSPTRIGGGGAPRQPLAPPFR
ncbi:MAG: hypothetical protein ACJ8LG_17360 [Massilia sp.]